MQQAQIKKKNTSTKNDTWRSFKGAQTPAESVHARQRPVSYCI